MAKGQTRLKALRSNERRAIKDWPESERPREKLLKLGPEGLSDGELLAVLLRIGALGQSAAIRSSDIIICDLTGQRPNVFVEAGFALKHHEKNRLIFLFEPRNRNDKVPFDLTTFKYVLIPQAAEIPNKVKTEIVAILRDTGAPI